MITVFFLSFIAIVAAGLVLVVMKSGTKGGRHNQSSRAEANQQEGAANAGTRGTGVD